MKNLILFFCASLLVISTQAQDKFFTKTGKVNFDATAPQSPEDIAGVNKSVVCVLDSKSGNIQFAVLMKGFEFQRALMQEHFNENYVESDKYPKTEFKGIIVNNNVVSYLKDGSYNATVKGKLTIHGETKDVEAKGNILVKGGKISASAEFVIQLSDYKITIPQLVADKVSKTAKIGIDCSLEPLKAP